MDKEHFEQELEEWRNIQATILVLLGRCSTETTAYVCGALYELAESLEDW